jgi:hypothetical protein
MPFIGTLFYFSKAPRYIPVPFIKAKLFAIALFTIVLPILLYYLLKTIGKASSVHLGKIRERIIPLVLNSVIILVITQRIVPVKELPELYYFFIGTLLSTMACLMLVLLKFKASIHMIASGGVLIFFVALSIHFSINIVGTIALFFVIIGAIATSRLHMKAHSNIELIIGFFVGVIPQIILLNYWL